MMPKNYTECRQLRHGGELVGFKLYSSIVESGHDKIRSKVRVDVKQPFRPGADSCVMCGGGFYGTDRLFSL